MLEVSGTSYEVLEVSPAVGGGFQVLVAGPDGAVESLILAAGATAWGAKLVPAPLPAEPAPPAATPWADAMRSGVQRMAPLGSCPVEDCTVAARASGGYLRNAERRAALAEAACSVADHNIRALIDGLAAVVGLPAGSQEADVLEAVKALAGDRREADLARAAAVREKAAAIESARTATLDSARASIAAALGIPIPPTFQALVDEAERIGATFPAAARDRQAVADLRHGVLGARGRSSSTVPDDREIAGLVAESVRQLSTLRCGLWEALGRELTAPGDAEIVTEVAQLVRGYEAAQRVKRRLAEILGWPEPSLDTGQALDALLDALADQRREMGPTPGFAAALERLDAFEKQAESDRVQIRERFARLERQVSDLRARGGAAR